MTQRAYRDPDALFVIPTNPAKLIAERYRVKLMAGTKIGKCIFGCERHWKIFNERRSKVIQAEENTFLGLVNCFLATLANDPVIPFGA
jgi:hypothetical protein